MDGAEGRLKRVWERLTLAYSDGERASRGTAVRRGRSDFQISLSRLADIDNRRSIPRIFRLFTLSAIYHLNLYEVMRW
jgi:hypothetical protein